MNTRVLFAFSMIVVCMLSANSSYAQFWKNWGKNKDKEKEEKMEYRAIYPPPVQEPVKKVEEPAKEVEVETLVRDRYRIDLLAPFYLNDLVQNGKVAYENRYPDKALPAIYFYEGMLIAADTLKKMGYKLDVHIHDVTDPDHTPQLLVNTDALDNSDLILGAVSSRYFEPVTDFAKENSVNFISVLSPSDDDITHNPYFTMLQPTLETHCSNMRERLVKKQGRSPVVMLYRDNISVDRSAYECFDSHDDLRYIRQSVNEFPTQETLEPYFDVSKVNVIVMPIISDDYAEMLLKKLYEWFPEHQFEVWGMPSWNDMASLRQPRAYPNVAVYYTSPYYFDKTTAVATPVIDKYKAKYGRAPNQMVFRGYETMMWYSALLKKYGPRFNEQIFDNSMAPFTRFIIEPVYDEENMTRYNENKNLYLYRYQGSISLVNQ